MIPGGWLGILAVGIILGALGQGARTIVGLKKLNDYSDSSETLFDGMRLLISFGIGGVAGAFAAMTVITDVAQVTKEQLLGIAAAGYTGSDFIEGFISQISGGASSSSSNSAAPTAAGNSSDDAVG